MADPAVSPAGGSTNSPAPAPALEDLQAQLQSVHQSEQSEQKQLSQALHLGTATPADVAAAANAIRQIQAQRQVLEGQIRQLTAQQNPTSLAEGTASFASGLATGLSTAPVSPASPAALTPVLAARQSLMQQISSLKQQGVLDNQTLANVLSEWQAANAAVLAQAQQSEAAVSATNRPKILARLIAGSGQTSVPASLPPNAQALLSAQQTAAKDLAIIVLQSGGQSPETYQAALGQWQATHGPALSQLSTAALTETKAIGVAAAQALGATPQPTPQ